MRTRRPYSCAGNLPAADIKQAQRLASNLKDILDHMKEVVDRNNPAYRSILSAHADAVTVKVALKSLS